MPFFKDFYEYAKRSSIIFGIFFNDIITFISYIISLGAYFITPGDIQMLFGVILGVIFSLKYRKPHQSPLLYGIFVGIMGTFLSAFTLSLFQMAYIMKLDLVIFIVYLFPAIIIGPLIGAIIGLIYKIKQKRTNNSSIDEDFYNSLEDE